MKFKDWKPVLLSCCLAATSIGSPGKVFAEMKVEYVNVETVFEECPLNQISTMDYNGDLSTWTEVSEYYQYFDYDSNESPYLKGNKIDFSLPQAASAVKWSVFGRVPYFPSQYGHTYDLLFVWDYGDTDISSSTATSVSGWYYDSKAYPWHVVKSSRPSSEQFVNDGQQIWYIVENLSYLSFPCVSASYNGSSVGITDDVGVWQCHIYYRDNGPQVNVEGGGSSGGGDSGSGGGSGGSSST